MKKARVLLDKTTSLTARMDDNCHYAPCYLARKPQWYVSHAIGVAKKRRKNSLQ